MRYEKLFSPLRIKGCTLPNRIMATAAVTRLAAEEGHVTEALKERYRRMARGGVGAMVVEAAVVLPSKSSFNLRVSDDWFISELKELVDGIRLASSDVKIGLQLIHFLKLARSGWRQKVEDLKLEEIKVIPEQFARGALRAQMAGFDFVELHMAHFTTLASFLSLVNKRKDSYGGDFEGRVKLPMEVVVATRGTVGDDFPIGVRINGEEFIKEGNTLLQSTRIARRLADLGVGYISVSAGEKFEDAETPPPNTPPFAGTGYSGYRMSPRWWHPDGTQVYLAEAVCKVVREAGYDLPIVTAGKIRTPELAEEILEKGRADIIGMARALLADPDWPIKAKEGRADEIVKCAACGYCSEADERYEPVTCIEWPKGALNVPSPWFLIPPCKAACPAGLDIRTYIEFIAQGHYEQALCVIEEKIPLPGTVGRVCPRPCEGKCLRGHLDTPIAINGLKRFVADTATLSRRENDVISRKNTKEERVAIIGSGPAGLTAAFHLVKLGYPATIFEALSIPGGMLTVGIPEYRLPREVVQSEIETIRKQGVKIRFNSPIGTGKSKLRIDHLWRQGYKAIFIATGAHKSVKLGIPGEEMKGVYDGISLLKDVNLGKKIQLGRRVIIIGGGNVAIDAARVARRFGVKEVSILYRRSEEEMPAYREDVEAAKAEGIEIHYLTSPARIMGKDGKVTSIECVKTKLGEADESGRKRPEALKGSEFVIEADTVVPAIGEIPDLSFQEAEERPENKTIRIHPRTMMTDIEGIFAGGDVVSGPATVIEAMAAGRKAAFSIDRYLRGESLEDEEPLPRTIGIEDVDVDRFPQRERLRMSSLPMEERVKGFKEIEHGFTEMEALCEADRCFQCGLFPKRRD